MLTKSETIALAETHGYGTEAAALLLGMSAHMLRELASHEVIIDANNGAACYLFAGARTRAALLSRELVKHHRSNDDQATRKYTITELGYRVLGLNELRRRAAADPGHTLAELAKMNARCVDEFLNYP